MPNEEEDDDALLNSLAPSNPAESPRPRRDPDVEIRCPHCKEHLVLKRSELELDVECHRCRKTFNWAARKAQIAAKRQARKDTEAERRREAQLRREEEAERHDEQVRAMKRRIEGDSGERTTVDGELCRRCPDCAEWIMEAARVCKHCGWESKISPSTSRSSGRHRRYVPPPKSSGAAAVLSVFLPGLGQLYCGRFARAFLWWIADALILAGFLFAGGFFGSLAGSIDGREGAAKGLILGLSAGWLAGIAAAVVFHFWQIYDAYACAEDFNRRRAAAT